jgi:saccharopine dehydrogenase (NAD+, L-lysine forming)
VRILVIGAGGVGSAVVPIAARRDFFERMVMADYDAGRAERAIARFAGDGRLTAYGSPSGCAKAGRNGRS